MEGILAVREDIFCTFLKITLNLPVFFMGGISRKRGGNPHIPKLLHGVKVFFTIQGISSVLPQDSRS